MSSSSESIRRQMAEVEGRDAKTLLAAAACKLIQTIVDEQAEDPGLWSDAETAPEAYLQAALRRLHFAIETGNDSEALHHHETKSKAHET